MQNLKSKHEFQVMSKNPISNCKLGSQFESALVYASQLHATQVRKGSNIPYISHLLSVAALVLEDGGTEEEAMPLATAEAVSQLYFMMPLKTKVEQKPARKFVKNLAKR
jgi:(p)ppGpp synthase/HD superfamily hydrolase